MRPLASLSPGERFRAALICLLERRPPVEVLVLDEPTYGLDFVGLSAPRAFLRAWLGGLIVVSHDRELLQQMGIDRWICLDDAPAADST
jgi:ATPase subunit of ABC transporter with duplicated ATPase domains